VGNLVRARRWDLTTTEKTTFGTPASVNGTTITHPTRNPEVEMRYKYDGGQRVIKTVTRGDAYATSHNDTAPKYTVYAFSTLELRSAKWVGTGAAADYELTSATTELMLPAGSVMGRVVSDGIMPKTGTTQQHLLLTFADHLGSTTFTIDHATSELVEYTTYTAYGQTESDYRTSRWDNRREPRRFTGKEEDIEVGLNYHGARYYSPAMKRWMSADPVTVHSAGSDINPVVVWVGNPTSFVDPDGREPVTLIVGVIVIAAVVAGGTNATVQYAQTGHVNWGWKGVAGAAVAGGVGAAVGMGMGGIASGILGNSFWAGVGAGGIGGAAGGAAGGAVGSRFATGSWNGAGKAALTGAVSGAVGGAVGIYCGSQSSNVWEAVGGIVAGAGAGTAAGVGFGWAAWGEDVTWKSLGMSFATAFSGALAGAAMSKGWSAATEENTGGQAQGEAAGESAKSSYDEQLQTMAEKYTEELGARIASLPDYRTADIWLEGANRDERGLHLSVSIGNPNGSYKSFSFAAMGIGEAWGMVYEDYDKGGPILEYIKTDHNEDAQAMRYIYEQMEADSRPAYGAETCRTYSLDKMKIFKIMFRDSSPLPASVLQRAAPVRPWYLFVRDLVLGGPSSSGSSTSR